MEFFNKETYNFIREHRNDDVRKLAFLGDKYPKVDMSVALDQIAGWQTARHKLPSWAAVEGIIYPPHINMEQCSSEQTARYKAGLSTHEASLETSPCHSEGGEQKKCMKVEPSTKQISISPHLEGSGKVPSDVPEVLIDLTGGFGVDFSFMARKFKRAIYVEPNPKLCAIAEHNFKLLSKASPGASPSPSEGGEKKKCFVVVNATAEDFLNHLLAAPSSTNQSFISSPSECQALSTKQLSISPPLEGSGEVPGEVPSVPLGSSLVFLDPSRRDANGRKVVSLSDCVPDVLALLPSIDKIASRLMLKLSPMLDWHEAVRELNEKSNNTGCQLTVKEVHAVSVGNECKELLVVADKIADTKLKVFCVNNDQIFSYEDTGEELQLPIASPSDVMQSAYLYEPNASVMKIGCFAAVADKYAVEAVAANSHLLVSRQLIPDFPGRRFEILSVSTMNKKELRRNMAGIQRANVAVRNFPMSADALRKRLKLHDGGDVYIFGTTLSNALHVLIITKKAV